MEGVGEAADIQIPPEQPKGQTPLSTHSGPGFEQVHL